MHSSTVVRKCGLVYRATPTPETFCPELTPVAQPVTTDALSLEQLCINTIRTLSMDAVQAANSGHPGTPMALAPVSYVLWTRHLRHDPQTPDWPDRDRFVLSCGHASMLIYSLLYLTGYDLSLDDIKAFRQLGSRTPGHPEFGVTPGVETTTGPLGQGVGNAVGMALAEAHMAAVFNRPGHVVLDHYTYFFASDGDLMEGVSHEAASLAGHLGLGKLIGVYDDNRITIDGSTDLACSDDVPKRFAAYGWHVINVDDGNDLTAIDQAFHAAKSESQKPSLIVLRTHIAYGSPNKQDTAAAHGAALGEEEVRLTKQNLGWPSQEAFHVPEEALEQWRKCRDRGIALRDDWAARFENYGGVFRAEADELGRRWAGHLPPGWDAASPVFPADEAAATRNASGKALNAISPHVPELFGGSADLAGSVKTEMNGVPGFSRTQPEGRNVFFGVREHAMGSVMNGLALHGGVRPYGGTFLIFSDYMRPAIRLAAMMRLPTIYLFSHDSIGLGEDGPTHQPIETLSALRAIPGLTVIRPADARETVQAWRAALTAHGPVAIILTRQNVPGLTHGGELSRGAYVLSDPDGEPDAIVMASGSELSLAVEARERLAAEGVGVRVVNMPSMELFAEQDDTYRESVLPSGVEVRVAVEAGHPMAWYRWVGLRGAVVGLNRFGESGPYDAVYESLGITAGEVVKAVKNRLGI